MMAAMSEHSVSDAKAHLSALIDRALAGEDVVITRRGQPVVALNAVPRPAPGRAPRRMTDADVEWLIRNRVTRAGPQVDAGTLVSQMRDEDWW